MKCDLCSAELEENFLEKKKGTVVKINKNGKNRLDYICPNCQRQFGNKLKEELSRK
jgi:transposase-like protein